MTGTAESTRDTAERRRGGLSFAQRALWLNYQIDGRPWAYNIAASLRLVGDVDTDALAWCFQQIVQRHEVLRTSIRASGGRPVAEVMDATVDVPVMDFSNLDEATRSIVLAKWAGDSARWPFDHAVPPLIRVSLARVAQREYVLFIAVDHLVSDGWSIAVLLGELKALYDSRTRGLQTSLPPPPMQYSDFVEWQERTVSRARQQEGLQFWLTKLKGLPVGVLPNDKIADERSVLGARASIELGPEVSARIRQLARAQNVSLFMITLAIYKVLLAEVTGTTEAVVGTGIANRDRQELRRLVGLFADLLVLRTDLRGCRTFRDVVKAVRDTTLSAFEQAHVPFDAIVESLRPRRGGLVPFVQATFLLDEAADIDSFLGSDVEVKPVFLAPDCARYEWHLTVTNAPSIRATLIYKAERWEASTIERVLARYRELADILSQQPDLELTLDLKKKVQETQTVIAPSPATESNAVPSQEPGEDLVRNLWRTVLDAEVTDEDEEFFEAGGNSLLAVQLLGEIEQHTGIRLSMSKFFSRPTLTGLRMMLSDAKSGSASADNGPLVQLAKGRGNRAFFCVHPQSGDIRCFHKLAARLEGFCSFYAFKAPLPAEEVVPRYGSIEELASAYASAMQRVQSTGPYYVGGYSSGSLVAFEIARQLRSQGRRVGLLALMDGLSPLEARRAPQRSESVTLAGLVRDMARQAGIQIDLPHELVRDLSPEESLELVMQRAAQSGLAMKTERAWIRDLLQGISNRLAISRAYVPSLYDGNVVLFRSSQSEPESLKAWRETGLDIESRTRGWDRLLLRALKVHLVSGYHATMLEEPHVASVATTLLNEMSGG